MKTQHLLWALFVAIATLGLPNIGPAQVNSGSDGSDGAFNPVTNTVINMADRPNGIYQYTSVNISNGVAISFIPNANNTPVVWLVQSNVVVNGPVDVSGKNLNSTNIAQGGTAGPGGWPGGYGGSGNVPISSSGLGAGGGSAGYIINSSNSFAPGQASFGTIGNHSGPTGPSTSYFQQASSGNIYGNNFLIPLMGGSGGGGFNGSGGGGGGGAILIAANGNININSPGSISANGGSGTYFVQFFGAYGNGGGGSGGAVRLVATQISGNGVVSAGGGQGFYGLWYNSSFGNWEEGRNSAGNGRIRFDSYQNNFSGYVSDAFTQGSQFIIIPTTGQLPQLAVTSVGGVPVSASPTGALSTPDAILSALQNNPISVVVSCASLPLHSLITVSVKPAYGTAVSATGYNDTGTMSSSTATILINIPRGGGLIYATAAN